MGVWQFLLSSCFVEIPGFTANNVHSDQTAHSAVSDQMPHSVMSDLGLHCLLMSLLGMVGINGLICLQNTALHVIFNEMPSPIFKKNSESNIHLLPAIEMTPIKNHTDLLRTDKITTTG